MKGARLNPFEHALKRPDTYIGSAKTILSRVWVFDDDSDIARQKLIKFNPGLFNIVREIISNAIDNVWRSKILCPDNLVKKISISIKKESGEISVWNDGYSIPVHREEYQYTDPRTKKKIVENLYPAEIFFGDMFSGTNYDDNEVRKTSGRNGMGAKATNVFSSVFRVECANPDDKKMFTQVYRNNGTERDEPEIKAYKSKIGYTCISFIPDYNYFRYPELEDEGFHHIDDNFISLLKLYAYEVSMITNTNVKFVVDEDEKNIKIPSLEKYVRLFYPDPENNKLFSIKSAYGDECVLIENDPPDFDEQENISHNSFVNGIKTKEGGIHVDTWRDTLIPFFVRLFNSRKLPQKKNFPKVAAKQVYPYLQMFVRCEVDRPRFSSQTKDELTEIFDENGKSVPYILFNSRKKLEKEEWNKELDLCIKKMLKWNFISLLEEKLLSKVDKSISRQEQSVRRIIDKRVDEANEAGKKNALKCTGYIAEGLSAKAFVVRGISSIEDGKDYNGVMAIRGKFMNIQNATTREINGNDEINLLKKFFGLKRGLDYSKDENFQTLRYGRACIITDSDDDGIHIRGLLINFFYKEYPSLVERGYLTSFSTAVVAAFFKAMKTDKKLFYSNPDFKEWYKSCTDAQKGKIKDIEYYKGLGSIPPQDAPEYFDDPKVINYILKGDEEELMDMGFNSKSSDKRKVWIIRSIKPSIHLSSHQEDDQLILQEDEDYISQDEITIKDDPSEIIDLLSEEENTKIVENLVDRKDFIYEGPLTISTFVDKQLIIYHCMALRRALPNIWDGFKECQRKIFFAVRLRNYKSALDLEKIMGAVKELTAYHHGGHAMMATIVKMAQGFVGRNNIPLFVNKGEFGTRSGVNGVGGDHAAPRYLKTMEEEISQYIFSSLDDDLLIRLYEDNELVEYDFYMPIIPMLLVNGAEGIGCGWSTNVPNYNPKDLVRWIRAWLDGKEKELDELVPWYRGFKGDIELVKDKQTNKTIGWTSRGILEKGVSKEDKGWWHIRELPIGVWTKEPFEEWLNYLAEGSVPKEKKWKKSDIRYIKQIKDYSGANHVHYMIEPTKDFVPDIDTPGNLKIMKSSGSLRNMMAIDENNYPHKFDSPEEYLYIYCPRRLDFYNKRKEHILGILNFDLKKSSNKYIFVKGVVDKKLNLHHTYEELNKILEGDLWNFDKLSCGNGSKEPSYDYLLSMQMRSMTVEKLEELRLEKEKLHHQIQQLKNRTSKDLWLEDLQKFEIAYDKFLVTRCEEKERKKTVKKSSKK